MYTITGHLSLTCKLSVLQQLLLTQKYVELLSIIIIYTLEHVSKIKEQSSTVMFVMKCHANIICKIKNGQGGIWFFPKSRLICSQNRITSDSLQTFNEEQFGNLY